MQIFSVKIEKKCATSWEMERWIFLSQILYLLLRN